MLKRNLLKTLFNRSTWPTFASIRAWFTKTFREKFMLSNRLIFPNHGVYGAELILEVPIPPPACGLRQIRMKTFILERNTTPQGKRLTITLGLSTATHLAKELHRLMETPPEPNGSQSSPKEESTLPQPTKKSGPTSTHGLDSESRKYLRALRSCPGIQQRYHITRKHVGKYWECQRCLSSALAQILSESSKPTAGKKEVSRKPKT